MKQIVRLPGARPPGPADLRVLNGQTSPGATIVQRFADLRQCVRRNRVTGCDGTKHRKQLLADCSNAPQRRGPDQAATGVDCSPVR